MLNTVANMFLDFLFPKRVEVQELEKLSPSEILALLPASDPTETDLIVLFKYRDETVEQLVWEIKYRGNRVLGGKVASLLLDILRSEVLDRTLSDTFLWARPLLVPIPMHSTHRLERGFNQTEIICEEIMKLDKGELLEYWPNALIKKTAASQREEKSREDRLENIKFTIDSLPVKDKCIILLDDVTTTGATLAEARRALRASGARRVLSIALAH